nr:hypothetical protein [Tanacetum cinerariifolium]
MTEAIVDSLGDLTLLDWSSILLVLLLLDAFEILLFFVLPEGFDPLVLVEHINHVECNKGVTATNFSLNLTLLDWSSILLVLLLLDAFEILLFFVLLEGFDPLVLVEQITHVECNKGVTATNFSLSHYARNCIVRPRRRDAAYLQAQLLIAQKQEAGIQLQAEEYDLMAAAVDLEEIEEQASSSSTQTDSTPVYDSDGSAEVHANCDINEIFNMFTQEEPYTELLEPIPEPQQVPQNDNNVISKVTDMEQEGEIVEQHSVNFEETRALYDSLYQNLAVEVEKVNSTILLGLPEDIYAVVDSCETAQEIWLRVQQMMKGSNIRIQEKKAKLFNEWERFTSNEGESIESYYHRFLKLMNDLKRNKHFPEKIASNLKFLNNLQLEWSRYVTIVH